MTSNHIIELSAYTSPVVTEDKRNDWVNYGEDNNYFQFLIDRYSNSATHSAVVNNISRLIYGKGLSALDASKKPNDYAQMLTLFTANDLRRVIQDLYLLGQGAFQVHYDKGHKNVVKVYHIPVQLLRPEKCDKDGNIVGYYYSDNWEDPKKFVPKRFDAFGEGKSEIEILMIQPYSVGAKYFSRVDYQGALEYTVLEEKISEYLINEVSNGFSPTTIVNFNNSIPSDEQKDEIARSVISKLTGSTGKKIVVSFNEDEAKKTTIDSVPLNDAPEHYQYLSDECRSKILTGHCVTSPLIFGIATTTGFSANADELKNSVILFDNMVIQPKQKTIIEAISKVLTFNGISLDLEFIPLQPLDSSGELTDGGSKRIIDGINSLSPLVANKVLESMTANEIRALVGLVPEKGGSDLQPKETTLMSAEKSELEMYLDSIGEDIGEDWVLVDERDVDYDLEDELDLQLQPKKTMLSKVLDFVSTGVARPNAKSNQDKVIDGIQWKVRYQYTGNPNPQRDFCRVMMSTKKVYRREDLESMNSKIVNKGFEHNNEPYNVFLFKGGPRCKHSFKRLTFASLEGQNVDVNSPKARQIGTRKAEIMGYKITNPYQVSVQPNNLPRKGFHPNNENLPSDVK
jgi:hypothetical protein